MKLLGRLILLAVGVAIFALNIPMLINIIKGFDWSTFNPTVADHWKVIWAVVGRGAVLFTGLIALTCALVGKATFLLGLIAIIQIAVAGYNVYLGIQNGSITTDWKVILDTVISFIIPIGYFLGTLFISFGRSK